MKLSDQVTNPQTRWPVVIATVAVLALYQSLPEHLTFGPNWALTIVVLSLLVLSLVSHYAGKAGLNKLLGTMMLAVITVAEISALALLISGLPTKRQAPGMLLRSAVSLWFSNVLVCACWYWRLDAGGPYLRDSRETHSEGAFLFPQMTLPPDLKEAYANWKPGFIDYLFLAFNASTAFSPTDAPVLSRWAKVIMMVQSSISLGTLAILAARAINIL